MKAKDKNKGNIIIATIIIVWTLCILCYLWINKPITYASSTDKTSENIQISNAEKVDIEEILNENMQATTREEIVTKEVELEYITKYQNTNELVKGTTRVATEGRNGTQKIITKKIYDETGKLIKEEQVGAVVVKSSINKIVEIGTADPKKIEKKASSGSGASGLSFNMALNKPSGFSLEPFKKALTDSKEKNKILENKAN